MQDTYISKQKFTEILRYFIMNDARVRILNPNESELNQPRVN